MRVYSVEALVDLLLMLAGNVRQGLFGPGGGLDHVRRRQRRAGRRPVRADGLDHAGTVAPNARSACGRCWFPSQARPIRSTSRRPPPFAPTRWRSFRMPSTSSPPSRDIQSLLFIVGSLASKAGEISDVICGLAERATKPVCVSWPSPPRAVPARLAERGIYSFLDPERGIRALGRLSEHSAALRRPARPEQVALAAFDWSPFVPPEAVSAVVPEHTCHRILKAAGLAVAAGELARDENRCGAQSRSDRIAGRSERASATESRIAPRRASSPSICARWKTSARLTGRCARAPPTLAVDARRRLRAEDASARDRGPRDRVSRSGVRGDGELRQRRRAHRSHRRCHHRARAGRRRARGSHARRLAHSSARGGQQGPTRRRARRALHRALLRSRSDRAVGRIRLRAQPGALDA